MNNTKQLATTEKGISICGQNFKEILFLSDKDEVLGMITDNGEIVWHDGYKVECVPAEKESALPWRTLENTEPLIIASAAGSTFIFSRGNVYGTHILGLDLSGVAPEKPKLKILADECPVQPMAITTEEFKTFLEALVSEERNNYTKKPL